MSMTNNQDNGAPLTKTPSSNPVHQFMFSIPKFSVIENPVSLPSKKIPQKRVITGDQDVDTVLWLSEICSTTNDFADLEKVLEVAKQITTPANELTERYRDFKLKSGAQGITVVLGLFGFGEIDNYVKSARYRINKTSEVMKLFGSCEAAMSPTAPERMLMNTTAATEDELFSVRVDETATFFSSSVNPGTLTEVLNEIRYWLWLKEMRGVMVRVCDYQHNDFYREQLVDLRISFIYRLLEEIDPIDSEEARKVASALKKEKLCDDYDTEIKILYHLFGVY